MGRLYSVVMDAASVSAAKDLLRLSAPSTTVVCVHSVIVTQDESEVSEQLPFQLQRSSTDGTGTSRTPEKLMPGDAAFGGTAVVDLSADTTISGLPLHRESVNVLNGFYWKPVPEERIWLAPSGRFVCRLETAPASSLTLTLTCVFESFG